MSAVSLGDLAHSFMSQRRTVALRQDLTRLTEEVASGQVSDVRNVLSGNYNYLTDLERSLELLDGYEIANTEATYLTTAMNEVLGQTQDRAGRLGLDLILAEGGPVGVIAGNPSENAKFQLEAMVASLNGDIAGQSLFAGTATNKLPLPTADKIIDELRLAVAGQTTPDDILTAAKAWFGSPTGFDSVIYSGSNTALAPLVLSENDSVSLDIKANDPAIKNMLMFTSLAALASDPTLGLDVPQQSQLFGLAGLGLQSNQDQIVSLRAEVGFVQERIELINTRNAAEETSLTMARNNLLEADAFETATQLEQVQFQLQALYSVTVRNSQLSLVNFI